MLNKTNKKFFLPILICILVSYLSSAFRNYVHANNVREERFDGIIDEKFIEFVNKTPQNSTFYLSSFGGNVSFALQAADIIKRKHLSVKLDQICISSCVDYLLPAFQHIYLVNNPVIALHGNDAFGYIYGFDYLKKNKIKYPPDNYDNCKLASEQLMGYWKANDVNSDYLLTSTKRLGIDKVEGFNGVCPNIVFDNKFWVPNSEQLIKLFGQKVTGTVCADFEECASDRIAGRRKEDKMIIGDKEYNN